MMREKEREKETREERREKERKRKEREEREQRENLGSRYHEIIGQKCRSRRRRSDVAEAVPEAEEGENLIYQNSDVLVDLKKQNV